MKSVVTSKGQVTIPLLIRQKANIAQGTELDFQIDDKGIILVRPLTQSVTKLKGIVKSKRRKPVSLREMKKAIREGAEESMK